MELYKNEIGTYVIKSKAFKDITEISASQIEDIAPAKKDGFALVNIDKEGELTILLAIKIKQGNDLMNLCNQVQNKIKENIHLMTGVDCKHVNIDIQGFI